MIRSSSILIALALTSFASAQVQISLGIRETGAGGGTFTNIGDNGGSLGGIEWVDLDNQQLVLDGTWQQFTFDLSTATLTAFAGSTANAVLDGDYGTIEHIRIRNANGITEPIQIWIDDIENTITPLGGSPTAVSVEDFEGYVAGTEVVFQEPGFSGSTAANILPGGTSGIDNMVASRTPSQRIEFQFVDNTATRWVRLTTFNSTNKPNPLIRFDQSSVVSFWMRGGECQPDLGGQGPGTAFADMCGSGLNAGEQSFYAVAGAPANAPGALLISMAGQSDLPFLGGTLVSFGGFVFSAPVTADANGRLSLLFPGDTRVIDLVFQSAFIDRSLPGLVTFTNAINAQYGR